MSTEPTPRTVLLEKLRTVAQAIDFVEKRGQNEHHRYSFTQAVDVVRDVRAKLLESGIVVTPGASNARHEAMPSGGKSFLTTVDLEYHFHCVDTGAEIIVPWVGVGADAGGDKGVYKAYTGGLKYVLLTTFLIATSDDPEHDGLTNSQPAPAEAQGTVAKDADRPAAPPIPLDRAKIIADAAVSAGLASWKEDANGPILTMEPVLKAKLADLGVQKLGQLNVDQAEDLEAFIAAEYAEAHPADIQEG